MFETQNIHKNFFKFYPFVFDNFCINNKIIKFSFFVTKNETILQNIFFFV